MKWMKILVIALALVAGSSAIASAQEGYGGWRPQNHDRDDNWRRGDGDFDRDDGYGRYGYQGAFRAARDFGFQDGVNDGAYDRDRGRSFRPEKNGNYKHGDHGYFKGYGDKGQYKAWYRQAYLSGYEKGYGRGGYPWRR